MRKSCFLSPEGGGYKEYDPVAYLNWGMTHSESLGSLDSARLKNGGARTRQLPDSESPTLPPYPQHYQQQGNKLYD